MLLFKDKSAFVIDAYDVYYATATVASDAEVPIFIRVNSYINWCAGLHEALMPALVKVSGAMDTADALERLSQRQSARDEVISFVFGKALERYPDAIEKVLRAVLWDFMYAMSHGTTYTDQCRLLNQRLIPRVHLWFKHADRYAHALFKVADAEVTGPEGVILARMEPSVMEIACKILLTWVPR